MEISDKSEEGSISGAENFIKASKDAKKQEESHRVDDRQTHHDQKRSMRRRVYKNLIAISVSLFLHNSSQSGLQLIQNMSISQTLSSVSLISSSAASSFSSFIVPIIAFKLLGFKWTGIIAEVISICYIIANYFPSYYTLIPAAIIHGLADVTLNVLRSSLIAALAKQYSNFSTRRPELTLIKFFAISSAIFHISHIVSSGLSAIVLNEHTRKETTGNYSDYSNIDLLNSTRKVTEKRKICGAMTCPQTPTGVDKPPHNDILILVIIYLVFAVVGIAILLIFLDNIKPTSEDLGTIKESLKQSLLILKNVKIWILVPIFLLMGSLTSFLNVDFARHFVSCGYGVSVNSIYTLIFGVSTLVFSILINQLAKFVNKTLMIIFVMVSIIVVMIYLHVWTIETSVFVVYGLGVYFGLVESTWHTFLHATIGMIFYDHQTTAFANFWSIVHSFTLLTLIASLFLCTNIKIYIILILAVFAFYSPLILEFLLRYEKRKEKKTKPPNKLDLFFAKFF